MQWLVYKVCAARDWQAAQADGFYRGSPDDVRDGYIHLSTAAQFPGTLAKYFIGQADLVLVAFDPAALGQTLKWEASRGGQLFPHAYEPIATNMALSVEALQLGAGGVPVIKDL